MGSDNKPTENARSQQLQRTSPSTSRGNETVVAATTRVIRTHPKKFATVLLWGLGIFCMLFAPAPVQITPEMQARYQEKMELVSDLSADFVRTTKELERFEAELSAAKSFGWWFRSADRKAVNEIKQRMAPVEGEYNALESKRSALESDARNELGLWSEAGIGEARDVFWTTYKRGRRSAQVGIVWDLVWEMFRADNYEDSVNFLFRIIWIVVSNFVLFMITSTIVFTFKVISVIRSFQPSLISGLFFYLVAVLAALSTVGAMIGLVVGAGVGSAVVIGKNARYLPQSNRRRYVRQQRQHQA